MVDASSIAMWISANAIWFIIVFIIGYIFYQVIMLITKNQKKIKKFGDKIKQWRSLKKQNGMDGKETRS